MAYLDDFPLDQPMLIERPGTARDPVSGELETIYLPVGQADVFWWIGSGTENLISERFREQAAGIVVAYPGIDVKPEDRLTLPDGKQYRALYVEDIAMRDDVVQIPVAAYG